MIIKKKRNPIEWIPLFFYSWGKLLLKCEAIPHGDGEVLTLRFVVDVCLAMLVLDGGDVIHIDDTKVVASV